MRALRPGWPRANPPKGAESKVGRAVHCAPGRSRGLGFVGLNLDYPRSYERGYERVGKARTPLRAESRRAGNCPPYQRSGFDEAKPAAQMWMGQSGGCKISAAKKQSGRRSKSRVARRRVVPIFFFSFDVSALPTAGYSSFGFHQNGYIAQSFTPNRSKIRC